jgi:anti-sigma B factor antagonist
MTALQITMTSQDGATRIELAGELDIATGPDLEQALETQLARVVTDIVLDLRGVTFIDSSGLRVVLIASRSAAESGRRLIVVPGDGQVLRVIRLAQVEDRLDLGDS